MANYNFDLKTEKEEKRAKHLAHLEAKNKFISTYAIEGPKVDGGHNDVFDGFDAVFLSGHIFCTR